MEYFFEDNALQIREGIFDIDDLNCTIMGGTEHRNAKWFGWNKAAKITNKCVDFLQDNKFIYNFETGMYDGSAYSLKSMKVTSYVETRGIYTLKLLISYNGNYIYTNAILIKTKTKKHKETSYSEKYFNYCNFFFRTDPKNLTEVDKTELLKNGDLSENEMEWDIEDFFHENGFFDYSKWLPTIVNSLFDEKFSTCKSNELTEKVKKDYPRIVFDFGNINSRLRNLNTYTYCIRELSYMHYTIQSSFDIPFLLKPYVGNTYNFNLNDKDYIIKIVSCEPTEYDDNKLEQELIFQASDSEYVESAWHYGLFSSKPMFHLIDYVIPTFGVITDKEINTYSLEILNKLTKPGFAKKSLVKAISFKRNKKGILLGSLQLNTHDENIAKLVKQRLHKILFKHWEKDYSQKILPSKNIERQMYVIGGEWY